MVTQVVIAHRARRPEQKVARRQAILDEADRLSREMSFAQFTMSTLASRLGLAKGTLYLYFETKEQVFLALLEQHLDNWLESIRLKLAAGEGKDADSLANLISSASTSDGQLQRLLALYQPVVAPSVELTKLEAGTLQATAAAIEGALPGLAGQGATILRSTLALLTGSHHLDSCDVSPFVRILTQGLSKTNPGPQPDPGGPWLRRY